MAMLLSLFVSSRIIFTCVAHVVCTVDSSGVQLFMQQLEGRACTKLTHALCDLYTGYCTSALCCVPGSCVA